jgi:hypothetical protein
VVKSKGEGDSVFAVFRHVRDAVTAALVVQCALSIERWATSTPLRVRMAIHTGQIELRDGDYYGPTVNRCARLRALAKGGQVLLSGVTAKLSEGQLPADASLNDLGTHQLKDLSAPERVWQLSHPLMPGHAAVATETAIAKPAAPSKRAYKLTDHLNCSADGREWGTGVTHSLVWDGEEDDADQRIRCYTSPAVAALLNAQHERFRLPRLWEATVDEEHAPSDGVVACQEVTTLRQVPLPTVTGMHHARFAVMCARVAYEGGEHGRKFVDWASGWLAGQDSSGVNARAIADELEGEAHRGSRLAHPEEMMAANAARSAMHASRLSWLAGRAREEESARAIELAGEAVRTALRMTRLDLAGLANQVLPQAVGPVSAVIPPAPGRILRALPT